MIWKLNKKKRIHLIVRDDDARNQITRLLKSMSAEVRTFVNARAFLTAPILEAPACLITEIKLDDSDGIALIEQMREHGLSTPVVVLADGNNSVNTAVKAIQAGAADFIEKPIVERDFIERMQTVLNENSK
jgi:two-component system response regulator FixJ